MNLLNILLAVFGLGILVAIHEAGHLLAARLLGMRVEVYSIGWGRALWSHVSKKSGTEYRVSLIPIGGYCKIAGMGEGGAVEGKDEPSDAGSYLSKPAWSRFLAIAFGPIMNYATAFTLAAGLLMVGMPSADLGSTIVGEVVPGQPAALAGLKPGDRIVSIAGKKVERWKDLTAAIEGAIIKVTDGKPEILADKVNDLAVVVERGGAQVALTVRPALVGGFPRIGVGAHTIVERLPPAQAIVGSARFVWANNLEIIRSLGRMVSGREKAQLAGPVGIVRDTAAQASHGALSFLATLAMLSIALAIFNFLPIPPLDGGRLVFLALEIALRRRVPHKVETAIHLAGFAVFFLLVVAISAHDVFSWVHDAVAKH